MYLEALQEAIYKSYSYENRTIKTVEQHWFICDLLVEWLGATTFRTISRIAIIIA